MVLFKLLMTALGLALCIVYLRHINSELTYLAIIGATIIMIVSMFSSITSITKVVSGFLGKINVGNNILKTLAKAIGIGYLTEFTANLIDDMGVKSLSDKVILCGKCAIIILSLPIVTDTLSLLSSLIN